MRVAVGVYCRNERKTFSKVLAKFASSPTGSFCQWLLSVANASAIRYNYIQKSRWFVFWKTTAIACFTSMPSFKIPWQPFTML